MAVQVFCNVCFCEARKPTPRFSLTSCGHVICEICLQKGKKDECLICRTPCRTVFLSKQIVVNLPYIMHHDPSKRTFQFIIYRIVFCCPTGRRYKGIPVNIKTISKKDFETKLMWLENERTQNGKDRNLAVGLKAMPLPGDHIFLECPLEIFIALVTTNPDIQSLFMGIDTLCKKYSKELTQISEFQEKHRKHLLAYHRQKTLKLEESLKKVTQQMHQMQCMKPSEQTTQLPFSSTSTNPLSIPSRKQNAYSSYSLHPSHPSTSEIMESMEIDPVPSPMRKPETPTGPTRLSLITPPQDGRMGSVCYRSSQSSGIMSSQNSRAESTRSTPIRLPHSGCSSSSGSQSSRRGSWATSDFRTPQLYPFTSPSPQPSVTRHPITISGLLQRQHLGSTNFGGHSTEI